MMQADPVVQAPSNLQNYNAFSYVINNPLSYTDPSGYFFKALGKFVKKYWRVIAAAVVTYFTAGAVGGWAASWAAGAFGAGTTAAAVAGGALTGAIAGAAGGLVATGTLKGALTGAVTGAAFGGLGGYGKAMQWGKEAFVGTHAMVGGVLSELQGGKFGHGFITAGVMKGVGMGVDANIDMNDVSKTVVMAIAGGTVSKLTGGKFGNGAMTSAIQFVVNQLARRNSLKAALEEGRMRNYDEMTLADNQEKYGTVIYKDGEEYVVGRSSTDVPWGQVVGESPNNISSCTSGAISCFFKGFGNIRLIDHAAKPIENAAAVVITVPKTIHVRSMIESTYIPLSIKIGAPVHVNSLKDPSVIHVFDASKNGG